MTPQTITLHRANADWGEAGSSGSGQGDVAQPGDATWLFRSFNTLSWATAGGDYAASASASQSVTDTGTPEWSGAGMVADVQFWLDNAASNFGWLILGDESTTSTARKFTSREGFNPPRLTVDYTSGSTDVAGGPAADAVWFAPPWPTPASGKVHLSYTLPRGATVSLSIHDPMGRIIRRLAAGVTETAGRHATTWDGRTDSGALAGPGVYLASLVVNGDVIQHRIPLLR